MSVKSIISRSAALVACDAGIGYLRYGGVAMVDMVLYRSCIVEGIRSVGIESAGLPRAL